MYSLKWNSQYLAVRLFYPFPLFLFVTLSETLQVSALGSNNLMTKLKQLITLIGDVNLHLFHLDSWRCKQTGWFIL